MMATEYVKRLLYTMASLLLYCTALAVVSTAAANGLVLESIEVIAGNDKPEQIVFKLNQAHTPKSFRLNGETPRLVFDFYGVEYPSEINQISDVGGNIISGIRVGKHNNPPKTRVVIDIQKDSPYLHEQIFNVSNNNLVVTLTPDAAEISTPQKPDQKPPRIEVSSAKVVHSESQSTAKSEPPESEAKGAPQLKETPVELATAPPKKVEDSTPSSSSAGIAPPAAPIPPNQISKPSGIERQPEVAKQDQPADSSATDEKGSAPRQDTPDRAATAPAEEVKESSTPSPEADTVADAQPAAPTVEEPSSPPDQPDEPSGADQQTLVAKPEQPAEPQMPEPPDIVPVLLDVSFEKSINESETVLFRLNHFYPPLVFGIEKGEPRVVCDFFDAEIDEKIPPVIEAGGEFVDRIMVTSESDPDKVRVELVLMPNRNYDLQQLFFKEDNLFVVIVKELPEDAAAAN